MSKIEKPRISVVICSCGGTLSEKINLERLVAFAQGLPDVVSVRASALLCRSEDERRRLGESIRKEEADRIVFAGCSPGIGKDFIGEIVRSAGIHPEMAALCNLRERCAWVTADKTSAAEKARLLLRGGIDWVRLSPHFEDREFPVRNAVLVLGAGVAGVETALELSRMKHPVFLIEKGRELVGSEAESIKADENIQVMTSATIARCRGFAGDFEVCLDKNGEKTVVEVGAIVIATGAGTADVEGDDFGGHTAGEILTEAAVDGLLFEEQKARDVFRPGKVVFFLLGLIGEHAKLNTIAALKQALILAGRFGCRVFIGCEDVKVAGPGLETLYGEVRESGVIFFKYGKELPEVLADSSGLRVKVRDPLLSGGTVSDVLTLPVDFLVLEQRFEPAAGASELQRILRIDTGPNGFFQSDNVLRLPAALNRRGIFVAGSARLPQTVEECIADAGSTALAVHQFLREGRVTAVEEKNAVEKGRCTLCLTCYRLCPHQAVSFSMKRAAEISDAACEACGVCSSDCPAVAIELRKHTNKQVSQELELSERLSTIGGGIVAFCCRQSAYAAAESAGVERRALPAGLHIVPVPCSGKIDVLHLLKAFECGAEGVLVLACQENNCKYLSGNIRARKRVESAKARLEAIGVAPERLELCNISSIQPGRFVRAVETMIESVKKLGR